MKLLVFLLSLLKCTFALSQGDPDSIYPHSEMNSTIGPIESIILLDDFDFRIHIAIDSILTVQNECPGKNVYWYIKTEMQDSVFGFILSKGPIAGIFQVLHDNDLQPIGTLINGRLVLIMDKANYFKSPSQICDFHIKNIPITSFLIGPNILFGYSISRIINLSSA